MSANEMNLQTQFINGILIPRITYADQLKKQGHPYQAILALQSLITVLPTETENDRAEIQDWAAAINMVRGIKGTGSASIYARADRDTKRNKHAATLYDKLEPRLWEYLHEKGYFNPNQNRVNRFEARP